MENSFLILLGGSALSLASAGGAWAQLALGADRPIYRERALFGLGLPSLAALALALAAWFMPQFDVGPSALVAAIALASGAALAGLWVGHWATIARGVLWPLTALAQAYALVQAVGLA